MKIRILIAVVSLFLAGCVSTVQPPPVELAPNQHPVPARS